MRIGRDLEDRTVGLEIGQLLNALGHLEMSIQVFEIVGDEALADGEVEIAERAYRNGELLANEEYLRLLLNYNIRIQGAERNFVPWQDTAARLAEKADRAGD